MATVDVSHAVDPVADSKIDRCAEQDLIYISLAVFTARIKDKFVRRKLHLI